MLETQHAITYAGESIPFHLSYSNRKSIEIAVHPNGLVTVKAPEETDKNLIKRRVYKRARWIRRQIRYFAQFDPRTPERQFVGGESHLYLGKKYRLKIRQAETDKVLLKHGFFSHQQRLITSQNILRYCLKNGTGARRIFIF